MASPCYIAWNAVTSALTAGAMAGTLTSATAGTVKTILQVGTVTPALAKKARIVEWGYIITSAAPATPLQFELIETGTVFATVTTIGTGVLNYNDVTGPASAFAAAGTGATGFNATAEGSITATRLLAQTEDTATYFKQQFPLGREPEVNSGTSLRIRVNNPITSAASTVICYVIWEE